MKSAKNILLDSNVLVYSLNASSEYFTRSHYVIQKVIDREWRGCIALQNLMETLSIATNPKRFEHPLGSKEVLQSLDFLLDPQYFRILYPSQRTIRQIKTWIERGLTRRGQAVYDLQLAATMLSNGVSTIVTANVDDFSAIKGIEVIDLAKVSNVS